jgi:hypothetical protein
MESLDGYNNNKTDDDFHEDIQEYIHRIQNCSNRSQAIILRTDAFQFIDQWRLQQLEQLDQHVRLAGQSIFDAYDGYKSR